ncbi:MAG: TIGR02147 family protein [Oligoflexia bacterium]|nr:TIGR02147 family protein [Oligoflexia bacterium]
MRDIDVFSYQDYREFLKDYYSQRRKRDKKFSIRFFARRAGLKSENYLKVVMDGSRSLTANNLPKFVKGLGLNTTQAEYFEALVRLNQAKDLMERQAHLQKIVHLKKKINVLTLSHDQMEFYAHWYNLIIFEMASQKNFNPDPEHISKCLKGKISAKQALDSLNMMLEKGILKRDESGKLIPVASQIASPGDVPREQIKKLQEVFLQQALEALHLQKDSEREIRSLTICLTEQQLPLFKEKIKEFQRELNTTFSTGEGGDVYQFNMQFYKITKGSCE